MSNGVATLSTDQTSFGRVYDQIWPNPPAMTLQGQQQCGGGVLLVFMYVLMHVSISSFV
jgi:hypothetical protein